MSKPLFRLGQLVQTTTYVQGNNRTVCTGERGTIRDVRPTRHGYNRYCVAFAVSNNSADGYFEYWCDEPMLEDVRTIRTYDCGRPLGA